jgi:hypothetical protein
MVNRGVSEEERIPERRPQQYIMIEEESIKHVQMHSEGEDTPVD